MDKIDLYELYLLATATFNTQQNGHLRPERNFMAWVNDISIELFNELCDEWEKTQSISDALSIPFLKSINVPLLANDRKSYDILPYPEDYGRFSSARIFLKTDNKGIVCKGLQTMDVSTGKCTVWKDEDDLAKEARNAGNEYREIPIKKIDNARWGSVQDHRMLGPTPTRPYLTQYQNGFKVAPRNVGVIIFDYLKNPGPAILDYTINTDGTINYDQSGSTQLEWTKLVQPTIIARLKKRYGSFIGEPALYGQGEAERKQTV